MYNTVECYDKLAEIITKMETPYIEMSEKEHGFICGLIRDHRPEKILEDGISIRRSKRLFVRFSGLQI